ALPHVQTWMRRCDNRLHSVIIKDYVWLPDEPASGDVREHGIYSFKQVIRSREQYGFALAGRPLLYGSVKIWGEIVEHEVGYRSQFAKIVSLRLRRPCTVGEVPSDLRAQCSHSIHSGPTPECDWSLSSRLTNLTSLRQRGRVQVGL